ncbi:BTB/POZ and MATH domain-containing protein 1-like [Triticum dicoccoides]|uniref:BTB/POZ and MATH domain-containing protein 1-like n=1 Tax=Triticum dicoccoides TaxID=85692 RepID=UPI001891DF19|nr:BTB/POZ and MATH domain-containing protein 1-like [Triticum dicoccoides]
MDKVTGARQSSGRADDSPAVADIDDGSFLAPLPCLGRHASATAPPRPRHSPVMPHPSPSHAPLGAHHAPAALQPRSRHADASVCRSCELARSAVASSGDGGKSLRSAIVADTASGHHLLTIHGYSCTNVPTGQKISSRPFQLGGHRWRIDYYPNGITSVVADYVLLSLILAEDVKAAVKAKHSFCLAGEPEQKQVAWLRCAPVVTYTSRGCCFYNRYSTFIRRKDLLKSKNLKNDSFTFGCDITIVHGEAYVSVPPCDRRGDLGKLLETEKGSDVVFEVDGETVAAHQFVLASRSPVFAAELFGPTKEGKADEGGIMRVEDMNVEVFKELLCFVYTGSLPKIIKEEEDATYQHMLIAADRFDMGRLKLICGEKLCGYIDVSTVATILMLAEQHHCEVLKKACFDFLAAPTNLRAALASDGLQHLSASYPSLMAQLMARSLEH